MRARTRSDISRSERRNTNYTYRIALILLWKNDNESGEGLARPGGNRCAGTSRSIARNEAPLLPLRLLLLLLLHHLPFLLLLLRAFSPYHTGSGVVLSLFIFKVPLCTKYTVKLHVIHRINGRTWQMGNGNRSSKPASRM